PLLPVRMLPYCKLPAFAPVILQVPVALVRAPWIPVPLVANWTAPPAPPIVTGVVVLPGVAFPLRPVRVVLVEVPLSLPGTAANAENPLAEIPVAVPLNDTVVVELLVGL